MLLQDFRRFRLFPKAYSTGPFKISGCRVIGTGPGLTTHRFEAWGAGFSGTLMRTNQWLFGMPSMANHHVKRPPMWNGNCSRRLAFSSLKTSRSSVCGPGMKPAWIGVLAIDNDLAHEFLNTPKPTIRHLRATFAMLLLRATLLRSVAPSFDGETRNP